MTRDVVGEGLGVVTVQVSVRACTVGELAAATPELSWTPVRAVDEQIDEPDELSATTLGELDDTTFLRVRAALPREPGCTCGPPPRTAPGPDIPATAR